jgi:hypothetical protein
MISSVISKLGDIAGYGKAAHLQISAGRIKAKSQYPNDLAALSHSPFCGDGLEADTIRLL